jgi:multiple sugar transport system substrate-binding protein
MKKTFAFAVVMIMLATMVIACGATPAPEKIVETVVVTQEVEKEVVVTKEVEKEVVVTKEVEKVVEVTPVPEDYGKVVILSTQANPVEEQEKMRGIVLADFPGEPDFVGAEEPVLLDRVLAEAKAGGEGSVDVLIALHGTYPTLLADDTLMDLSDMAEEASALGIPEAFMELGKLGTDTQYYIPVMQATYIFAANKAALDYLPAGADVEALTWEQVRDWGKEIEAATGEKKLGFPASDRGLMHRFLEGYIYPSYTGGMVTGFKSPEAVTMWEFVKDMWQYVNPQATTYAFMQEQLLSEEVWVAFDHTARLIDAFKNNPDGFVALPSPTGPAGLGFMPVVVGVAIPKNAPNPEGAKQMIRYLLEDAVQVQILREIGFFPVVDVDFPGFVTVGVRMEGDAVAKQAASPDAIPALLPVGLGERGGEINKIYRDTFTSIVLNDEDIATVLDREGANLQNLLNDTGAPCWPPDPSSTGPCQLK